MRYPVCFFFLLTSAFSVVASDITDVLPLTRDIIMVHFYDGYGIYHKKGQPRSNDRVVVTPLDVARNATDINRYPVCPGTCLCHWKVREKLQYRSESTKILLVKSR